MAEVDLDKSETVDFYEYLNVVKLLNDKTGMISFVYRWSFLLQCTLRRINLL